MQADYSHYDSALGHIRHLGPDLENGLTSHMPMVAEALSAMGHSVAAEAFVLKHRHEGIERPKANSAIESENWHRALSREERFSEWSDFFLDGIAKQGWEAILHVWARRLAPGMAGAAAHGVIRTGHAARAIAVAPTVARQLELADGLALWASSYTELPIRKEKPLRLRPRKAIELVPLIPHALRRNSGAITTALSVLAQVPEFARVYDLIDGQDDLDQLGWEMAELFASLAALRIRDRLTAIVYTHSITTVAAVLHIARAGDEENKRLLLGHAWVTGAALFATYADPPLNYVPVEGKPYDREGMIEQAVTNGDDHVIKLTEACLFFDAMRGSAAFSHAAQRAAQFLKGE